jgi:pyruvate/2-oxoglutarate dehydrogenase complex dihydrolipoamide acyltransferase (E2) component
MTSFVPMQNPSSFRKIATGMWKPPNDSTIYAFMDLDATTMLEHVQSYKEKTGVRVTMTHLVAQAVALALRDMPEINAKVHWGRILLRQSVDVFLQVSSEDGRDLSGVKVESCDRRTLAEIAQELSAKAEKIRAGADPELQKSRSLFRWLPGLLVRPMLWLSSFLVNELHLDLRSQGMPLDPFGGAMVTSVGMFGVDTAFAPFVPISRCPIIVLVNQVMDRPWAEQGKVVVRPVLRISGTFDHRLVDGHSGARFGRGVRQYLERASELDELAQRPGDLTKAARAE